MELIEVTRKSFRAQAVRVTAENMQEVADWCGGVVSSSRLIGPGVAWYIELTRRSGKRIIGRSFIFPGQWITKNGEQFTVYKHASFMSTFDQPRQKNLELEYKRGRVLGVLVQAAGEELGERTGDPKWDMELNRLADEIMKIFGKQGAS